MTDNHSIYKPLNPNSDWLGHLRKFNTSQLALLYLFLLTLAEATTTLLEARVGLVLHGAILILLLLNASLQRGGPQARFLYIMCMAPLIRLMSLSLPLPSFPFIYWYAVVGAPLFLAIFFEIRITRAHADMWGWNFKKPFLQILVGLTGIGLGAVEYLILRPEPLVTTFSLLNIIIPALILLIFTGLLEEVIFRGLMQYASLVVLGRFGITYVALVFAVLHLGYRSILDVLFVFAVAMYFGFITRWTGSIVGVTLAHGLTNIGLFLVFPFVIGGATLITPINSPVAVLDRPTAQPAYVNPGLLAPAPTRTPTPVPKTVNLFLPLTILERVQPPADQANAQNSYPAPDLTSALINPPPATTMVYIPAGSFWMGCDPQATGEHCTQAEQPLHQVDLPAYLIDRTEVTNLQYAACVAAGVCAAPVSRASRLRPDYFANLAFASYPVVNITWTDAQAYCAWIGKRLPTEAEWEQAARGNQDARLYPWGNEPPTCERINFLSANGYCQLDPVVTGNFITGSSPFGLLDMAGNVAEWIMDWFQADYYAQSPAANPTGPTQGELKVIRGGSWNSGWYDVRVDARFNALPDQADATTGFRCAQTP